MKLINSRIENRSTGWSQYVHDIEIPEDLLSVTLTSVITDEY